jgi:hypothetical protein
MGIVEDLRLARLGLYVAVNPGADRGHRVAGARRPRGPHPSRCHGRASGTGAAVSSSQAQGGRRRTGVRTRHREAGQPALEEHPDSARLQRVADLRSAHGGHKLARVAPHGFITCSTWPRVSTSQTLRPPPWSLRVLPDHLREVSTRRPALPRCSGRWALPLHPPGTGSCFT